MPHTNHKHAYRWGLAWESMVVSTMGKLMLAIKSGKEHNRIYTLNTRFLLSPSSTTISLLQYYIQSFNLKYKNSTFSEIKT